MEKLKKTKTFIFGKKFHKDEKTERGDPLGFFNSHSVAKHQKNAGGLSQPAPGLIFTCCSGIPGFGRGHGQGHCKYF